MSFTSTSAYCECVRNAMHIARPVFVFVDGSELVSESRVPAVPLRQQTAKGTTRGVLVGTGVSRPRLKRCRAHHGSRSLRDLASALEVCRSSESSRNFYEQSSNNTSSIDQQYCFFLDKSSFLESCCRSSVRRPTPRRRLQQRTTPPTARPSPNPIIIRATRRSAPRPTTPTATPFNGTHAGDCPVHKTHVHTRTHILTRARTTHSHIPGVHTHATINKRHTGHERTHANADTGAHTGTHRHTETHQ